MRVGGQHDNDIHLLLLYHHVVANDNNDDNVGVAGVAVVVVTE